MSETKPSLTCTLVIPTEEYGKDREKWAEVGRNVWDSIRLNFAVELVEWWQVEEIVEFEERTHETVTFKWTLPDVSIKEGHI